MKKLLMALAIVAMMAGCSQATSTQEDYKEEYLEIVDHLTIDSSNPVGSLTEQHDKVKELRIKIEAEGGDKELIEIMKLYESFCLGMIEYAKTNDEKAKDKASEDFMKSLEMWSKYSEK